MSLDLGIPTTAALAPPCASPWMRGRRWDFGWLIGSALIVPVVLVFVWSGASSELVTLAVTALIGGPHLFSTFLATYMDRRFRRSHVGLLAVVSVLVPALVVYLTLVDFQILLSFFIFAASVHVLHQNAYLTDIYRKRLGLEEPLWSRLVDYGLLMISIHPIASYKLVHGEFHLGRTEILIPSFLMTPRTYVTVWIAFAVILLLWLGKTIGEQQRGVLNRPKTLLIGVTTVIAFFVPLASSGARLELAFQSVNAWHSIQYLGIVWLILQVRKERRLIDSPSVTRLSGPGRAAFLFYGSCFLVTALLLGSVYGLAAANPWGLEFEQYYYMGILSCLLIHYVLDAWLFTVSHLEGTSIEEEPFATPSVA